MHQIVVSRLHPTVKLLVTDHLALVVNASDANKHALTDQFPQVRDVLWSLHVNETSLSTSFIRGQPFKVV